MHIIESPVVPLNTPIYGGFNHDAQVSIHGNSFLGSSNGFVVEFLSAEGVAFHFNVRMGCYGGENIIVVNSSRHGAWQCEERHRNVFFLNTHFHVNITCHSSHFSIHVNGHHLAHFHHRESPMAIHTLAIRGDVRIEKIHFENFYGHNGGGVQVGGGVAPAVVVASAPPPVVVAAPAPAIVVAPRPAPAVVIAPRPAPIVEVIAPRRPIVEVVVPPRRPFVEVVVPPRRPLGGGVVVVEKGRRHHHHH